MVIIIRPQQSLLYIYTHTYIPIIDLYCPNSNISIIKSAVERKTFEKMNMYFFP